MIHLLLLGLSDSLIISEFVDAVVLTVSLNKVKKNLVREAAKKISMTRSNFIGVVVNNVEQTKDNINSNDPQYGLVDKYMPQEVDDLNNENFQKNKSQNKQMILDFKNSLKEKSNSLKIKSLNGLMSNPKKYNFHF